MELRWLEDYIALARTRHFSRAAEAQNITQPTFSRRIKLLEDEMGTVLVDRNTLPLSLTPAGEIFLGFAERTAQQLRYTREQFEQIKLQEHNTLLVAATQTLYLCFYQDWVEQRKNEAELSFNLNSASWSSDEFVSALTEARVDICLCHWHDCMHPLDTLADSALQHITLAKDRLLPLSWAEDGQPLHVFNGSAKHPVPYIDYQEKSYFHGVLQEHLQNRAPQLHLLTMNRNMQSVSVKALVMEG
ncbi:MAG: LysR family transcriptional regulator, partial [Granulosicoccaceae bacterium]